MKSKYVLAGLLAIAIVALASIATVAAGTAVLTVAKSGVVWQITTNGQFSGKEITGIEAYYYLESDPLIEFPMPQPRRIVYTDNVVTLVFNTGDVSAIEGKVIVTGVKVTLAPGSEPFIISGPGFAFGGFH